MSRFVVYYLVRPERKRTTKRWEVRKTNKAKFTSYIDQSTRSQGNAIEHGMYYQLRAW